MAKISVIEEKQCYSNECYNFEEFLQNLDQYLGKPSHVLRVGSVALDWTLNKNNNYTIKLQGDEEAVKIARHYIREF